mmetsp:Transcript_16761/g.41281  ORF Transcript_16761/g.41281 Transcript_16761/m.41281 type:complete len:317 (-) Transcript_16761:92-1042(-)
MAFCCSTDKDSCDIWYSRRSRVASRASSVVTLSSRLMSFTSVASATMAFTRSCRGFACANFSRMSPATSRMRSRTVARLLRAALRSSCFTAMTFIALSIFAESATIFSSMAVTSSAVCSASAGLGTRTIHSWRLGSSSSSEATPSGAAFGLFEALLDLLLGLLGLGFVLPLTAGLLAASTGLSVATAGVPSPSAFGDLSFPPFLPPLVLTVPPLASPVAAALPLVSALSAGARGFLLARGGRGRASTGPSVTGRTSATTADLAGLVETSGREMASALWWSLLLFMPKRTSAVIFLTPLAPTSPMVASSSSAAAPIV